MGTPEFALPSLDILAGNSYPIPAVVTVPDKPRGRGQEVSPSPVKERALSLSIPVLQPESLKDPAFADELRRIGPDIIAVVAFRILPKEVFTIPHFGSFNLHASLLPKYRGAAPINWAIINGETETGVTTFLLQEKVDTGALLLQRAVPILPEETAGSLHDRLALLGAGAVLETVRMIETGKATPVPQPDALATLAPKITKEECRISWAKSARRIHDLIRGLSPHPAAYSLHAGRIIKVYRSRIVDSRSSSPPGTVTVTPGMLRVATVDSDLALEELQQEGRKRMGVEEFLRGYRITSGERLG